ncbi:MAG TPA: acyltransferase [Chitinophagaceae bacterium]|nr:acyltransferase [Chitinophagaceae bacterium]
MENHHGPYISSKKYIPQLDGIRGLAILLVITYHYFGFLKIFSFGWTGVDVFFVLSGYLITSRLYAFKNDKNYFSKFYTNRALRILPVYYASLIIFYAGFNLLLSPVNLPSITYYNNNWWSFLLFLENWTFIKQLPSQDHLLHFWSLAIEEQFYLIWPLFIYIFLSKKYFNRLIVLLLLAIITLRCLIYLQHPTFKDFHYYFFNTFCRMDGFIMGGGLFLLQQKRNLKPVQNGYLFLLGVIAIGIYFTNTSQANPFISTIGFTLLALFFAGLINFVTINPNSSLSKVFKVGWLIFIGRISYGLYIYHWIIYRIVHPRFAFWMNNMIIDKDLVNWISLVVCLIVSLVISTVSYFYFESYFLKLKRK